MVKRLIVNTSNFIQESLNYEEAEDWLSFDNLTDQYFDSENWSGDCIYNYPEAPARYSVWSNPWVLIISNGFIEELLS